MKRILYISFFTVICSTLFLSCSESFLDQERQLVSTEPLVFTNAAKCEAAVLGLYSGFKGGNFMGGRNYIAFDARGEDIENIDRNGVTLYNTYIMQVNSSHEENSTAWAAAYSTINRANVFIESIAEYKTADVIGVEKANQYVAEAKFLRGLTYYYLANMYSEPYKLNKNAKAFPLRLTAIKESGHSDCASSTISKVYEAILNDVSDAQIAALPATATIKTRATKAAAYMLRMRVYMAMENWSAAIAAGEAVSGYTLVDNVAAQFVSPFYTAESIFSCPMSTNDQSGTQRSCWEYYYNGRLLVVDKANGIMSKPNYSLPTDKRIIAFDQTQNGNPIVGKWYDASNGRLKWVPIMRFAETKLNLAECYAQSNNPTAARKALSDVRRRAITAQNDPLNIDELSGAALLEAISFERRLEFLGEGMRGIDILRKGETFKPGTSYATAPGSPYYVWPFPETEKVVNKLWNDLEK